MYFKQFASLIAFLLIFFTAHVQTLYNLKYSFSENGEPEQYNAFMVRYDDGTGFIRVNFSDENGVPYLIDMDMEEGYDLDEISKEVDSSMLYFTGISPEEITGKTEMEYEPDIFVFKLDESGEFYDPFEVWSVGEDENITVGKFSSVELIEDDDLTEDFVLQFFTKDDEFYKALFETSVRQLTSDQKKATLNLVIVANTNDPSIGSTCSLDKDRTLKTFSDVADFMKLNLNAQTIAGNDYNKTNVEKTLSKLNPSERDIVVFYYSGHGFSKNDNRQYPYIELRSKSFESLNEHSIKY